MPSHDLLLEGIHRPAFGRHRPVTFGVKSNLASSSVGLFAMHNQMSNPAQHSRATSIGFAFDLSELLATDRKLVRVSPINQLIGANPYRADVLLDLREFFEAAAFRI